MKIHFIDSVLLRYIVLVLLVFGCSSEPLKTMDSDLSGRTVLFVGEMLDEKTKGLVPLENVTLFTMGVYAGYEEEDETFGPTSPANDYIDNVRYTRSFITNPFAGADVCYWPFSGKLSFFAYAPYISRTFLQAAPDYVSGYPRLSYSPTANVTEQPDFCIADPVLDRHTTAEPIPLVFHHAMSQVLFSANYSGELPDVSSDLYIKVDSIRICNVIGTKTVSVSDGSPCFEWQDDDECPDADRVNYVIERSKNQQIKNEALPEVTDPVTDNYMELTTFNGVANGVMYLLPQSMDYGEVYLKVTYGYYEMVEAKECTKLK